VSRRRPLYGLAALALGAALSLTACSGGGSAEGTASPSATAPVVTAAAQPAALTKDSFVTRIAAAEKDTKTMRMDVSMVVAGQKITMKSTVDGRDPAKPTLDETVDVPGQTSFDVRAVDGAVFLNYGALSKNKWIKIDPKDKSNPLASQFSGLLDGADPAQQLEAMKGAILSVEKEGEPATLDGSEVQQYVVSVDTSKVGAALTKQLQSGAAALPDHLTYTYWIGTDDDLPRKAVADVAGVKMTMTFSHWGEPVTITAPSKDDILPGGLEDLAALQS